jgi:glycyl-tRNA synthetase
MCGLDCSIIMHPQVWKCSGHYDLFCDMMQTCRQCKKLFRADQVWEGLKESEWVRSLAGACSDGPTPDLIAVEAPPLLQWAKTRGRKVAPGLALVRNPEVTLSWLAEHVQKNPNEPLGINQLLRFVATEQLNRTGLQTPCPNCGGDLTEPREFNLMFETYHGAVKSEENKTFLRPETAQGIFVNFKNVLDSSRVKVPFGIAQIGKSFRNEITPKNYTFRSREFEQMEIEFFCKPAESRQWYTYWRDRRFAWYTALGMKSEKLRLRDHAPEELSHYSCGTADIEYAFPFLQPGDFGELEGVAHRGDFDLRSHMEGKLVKDDAGCLVVDRGTDGKPRWAGSGKDLSYFDDETKERFVPHVIEPSAGADRGTLAFLCEAYTEDAIPDEKGVPQPRVVMKLHPRLAPVKAAIFPLVKRDGMPEIAADLYRALKKKWNVFYDEKGAIGRRYRRQDEAGTPFCITIDGQTLTDQTVTIRDRDTCRQWRTKLDRVADEIQQRLG